MTREPLAPGAAAIILYREVDRDDSQPGSVHENSFYRVKILTEEGRKHADVEIPFIKNTDAEYSFGSYHSKTEVNGGVIRYTRTYEVKELSVPVDRADELKKFYRTINSDERNTVVLKAVTH